MHNGLPDRTRRIASLAALALLLVAPGMAQAEGWPQRPFRVVVPYAPGGLTDAVGRTLAEGLAKSFGAAAIVDNKAGAGSIIGTDYVAKSPPDGYTLLIGAGPIATAEFLYPKLPYKPSQDLVPIGLAVRGGLVLVARPDYGPAASVASLVAYAKTRPGQVSSASFGSGTLSHMILAQFEADAGVALNHVAYRGSAPALQDVIGGQADLMFDNVATSLPLIKAGRLKALAYTGATRASQLPGVPTLKELGYSGSEAYNFYGVYAPKGTPADIVSRLNAEVLKIFSDPRAVQRFSDMGAEMSPSKPEELAQILTGERARWGRLIKARNMTPD